MKYQNSTYPMEMQMFHSQSRAYSQRKELAWNWF